MDKIDIFWLKDKTYVLAFYGPNNSLYFFVQSTVLYKRHTSYDTVVFSLSRSATLNIDFII